MFFDDTETSHLLDDKYSDDDSKMAVPVSVGGNRTLDDDTDEGTSKRPKKKV